MHSVYIRTPNCCSKGNDILRPFVQSFVQGVNKVCQLHTVQGEATQDVAARAAWEAEMYRGFGGFRGVGADGGFAVRAWHACMTLCSAAERWLADRRSGDQAQAKFGPASRQVEELGELEIWRWRVNRFFFFFF